MAKRAWKMAEAGDYLYFEDYEQARNAALKWLEERGFVAEKQNLGKFHDAAGIPNGMQTADGKIGFRVEFDENVGAHINVRAGKEKGPHFLFSGSKEKVEPFQMRFR